MYANPNLVYGTILVSPNNTVLLIKGRRTGKWSFPKGHSEQGETEIDCALRETYEETGIELTGKYIPLGSTFNKWGKEIFIWALEGKGSERFVKSNLFEMEWPKGSGKMEKFPEADKGRYMSLKEAKVKAHSYTL